VFRLSWFGKFSSVSVRDDSGSSIETEPSEKNISFVSQVPVEIISHCLFTSPLTVAINTNSSGLYGRLVFEPLYTKFDPLYSLIRLYGPVSAV
jgi:hypothetical protein